MYWGAEVAVAVALVCVCGRTGDLLVAEHGLGVVGEGLGLEQAALPRR